MKKATAFAESPDEKEKPSANGHRAQKKNTKSKTHTLTGRKEEVRAATAVVITWSDDPRECAKQFGEWGRAALLLTHNDKVAMRIAWAVDKLFLMKNKRMGWSAPELARWLGVSLSTAEDGLNRISRMGLLINADTRKRSPDGKFVTTMTEWLLAMPADYTGPKTITSLKKTGTRHTSDVLENETSGSVRRAQNAHAPDPERARSKTSQENASNQSSERKQKAGDADPSIDSEFSADELALIEKEAMSDTTIKHLIDSGKIESRAHAINRIRLSLSSSLTIEKDSPRWHALYSAVELACQRATVQAVLRKAEREREAERVSAARRRTPAEHFAAWKATWNEPRLVGNTGMSYEFWAIGDDVGLSREQLERKSRRQAASDFDRFTEKWAESFGSDRPFRPRFNELPEELQRGAIRFIEEKNLHLLDDGFDEVA